VAELTEVVRQASKELRGLAGTACADDGAVR
jgi:hypothetical protein